MLEQMTPLSSKSFKNSLIPARLIGNTIWQSHTPPGAPNGSAARAFADLRNSKPGPLIRFISWIRGGVSAETLFRQIAALDNFAERMQCAKDIDQPTLEWAKEIIANRITELGITTPRHNIVDDDGIMETLRYDIGLLRAALIRTTCCMTSPVTSLLGLFQVVDFRSTPTILTTIEEQHTCRHLMLPLSSVNNESHGVIVVPLLERDPEWIQVFSHAAADAITRITPSLEVINRHIQDAEDLVNSHALSHIISQRQEMAQVVQQFSDIYPSLTSPTPQNNASFDAAVRDIVRSMTEVSLGSSPAAQQRNDFLRAHYRDYPDLINKLLHAFTAYISLSKTDNHETIGGQAVALTQRESDIVQRFNRWSEAKAKLSQCAALIQELESKPEQFIAQPKWVLDFCREVERLIASRHDLTAAIGNLTHVQNNLQLTCALAESALKHANTYLHEARTAISAMDGLTVAVMDTTDKKNTLDRLLKTANSALLLAPEANSENGISLVQLTEIMRADEKYKAAFNEWLVAHTAVVTMAENPSGGIIRPMHRHAPPSAHFDWNWMLYRDKIHELHNEIATLKTQLTQKYDEILTVVS